MQLSHRLYTIAKCVPNNSKIIDVGTDHAYIPIYLIKNHIAFKCIATDINRGPLQKAKLNMKLHDVDAIDLRLTNGLRGIEKNEGNVVIIAGMGGHLIINILKQDLELVKDMDKLILQPQQDIHLVRRYLHFIGFKIENEEFIQEDDKYYTIITATPGNEKYKNDYEYIFGKILIKKRTALFKNYLLKKQQKLSKIYGTIQYIDSQHSHKRKLELEKELEMYKEVIQCMI